MLTYKIMHKMWSSKVRIEREKEGFLMALSATSLPQFHQKLTFVLQHIQISM